MTSQSETADSAITALGALTSQKVYAAVRDGLFNLPIERHW